MASLLRKVASNSLGFLVGRGLAGVVGVLLLRALGPEQSGLYGTAFGIAGLFAAGASLGLDTALAGAIGRDPGAASQRWSAASALLLLQALGVTVGLVLFLRLGGGGQVPATLIALAFAVLVVNALGQLSAGAMQGLGLFGRQALLGSLASALNAGGLLALLLAGSASAKLAMATVLATACAGALLWWRGRPQQLQWRRPDAAGIKAVWTLGLPFAALTLSNLLFLKADQALLTHWVLPTALGFYVAAVRLVDLLVPALVALMNPLHPHLAGLFTQASQGDARAGEQAGRSLNLGLRYMGALCWPLGVGGSVLAGPIIAALYGPAFLGAGPALAWLVWVAALSGIQGSLMQAVLGLGRAGDLARLYLVNFGLNMALNLWLIPHYGILASAAVSVLGEVVNLTVLWLWCRRRGLGLPLKGLVWPALPAALSMGALLALLGPAATAGLGPVAAALLLVASGAALYAGALAALGFIGAQERALAARLLGRAA